MSSQTLNRHEQSRGAALMEFALGFLTFILLVMGLMELGRAVWTYTTIAEAARQGARYAMAHGSTDPVTNDQITSVVQANAVGLDPNALTVSTSWTPDNERGGTVQVRVQYPFQFVTPWIASISSVTMGSTSRMIIAN